MEANDAIKRARDYVKSVYADTKVTNVMLEEIEKSEDGRYWHVTIGFTRPAVVRDETYSEAIRTASLVSGRPLERDYKQIVIDDASGEVVAMRIRNFAAS